MSGFKLRINRLRNISYASSVQESLSFDVSFEVPYFFCGQGNNVVVKPILINTVVIFLVNFPEGEEEPMALVYNKKDTWADIEKEFTQSARERRNGRGFFRKAIGGFVAFLRFDETKFLDVAREGGLSDAHALRCEAAAKLFLIGDASAIDEAKDLTVAKCFTSAHIAAIIQPPVFLYSRMHRAVNSFSRKIVAMRAVARAALRRQIEFGSG